MNSYHCITVSRTNVVTHQKKLDARWLQVSTNTYGCVSINGVPPKNAVSLLRMSILGWLVGTTIDIFLVDMQGSSPSDNLTASLAANNHRQLVGWLAWNHRQAISMAGISSDSNGNLCGTNHHYNYHHDNMITIIYHHSPFTFHANNHHNNHP